MILLQAAIGLGLLIYGTATVLFLIGIPVLTTFFYFLQKNKFGKVQFSTLDIFLLFLNAVLYSILSIVGLLLLLFGLLFYFVDFSFS